MSNHSFTKSLCLFGLILFAGSFVLTMPPNSAGQVAPAANNASALLFVENAGQFDAAVRFRLEGEGRTLWLTEDALWLSLVEPAAHGAADSSVWQRPGQHRPVGDRQGVHLKLMFVGANPRPRLEAFDERPARFSYFIGNDPAGWHSGVATWGGVRYVELYPGIDLEVVGADGRLAPRLVCGGNCGEGLQQVALQVEGADRIEVVEGQLRMGTAVGEVTLPLLQVEGGGSVAFSPRVQGNRVVMPFGRGVERPARPEDEPADLLYSTFIGGSAFDIVSGLAVDGNGDAYVTGSSSSVDFPTTAGVFLDSGGGDSYVFITKLNNTGSDVHYTAFLGGNGYDGGESITIDGSGAVYVTGSTNSTNFPTTFNAYDRTHNGYIDGFVAKVESEGTILTYGTYVGGSDWDEPTAIVVDTNGLAYIAGFTQSANYPITVNGLPYSGNADGFVTKLDGTGSNITFSTLIGGFNLDWLYDLALDSTGAAYVTGITWSADYPILPTAFDQTPDEVAGDGFISKFDNSGTLVYSTFFGGTDSEGGTAIQVNAEGAMYVAGATASNDFPVTAGAYETTANGSRGFNMETFVLKVNSLGTDIIFSTLVGGTGFDFAVDMDIATDGSLYVSGNTDSSDFPTTAGAFDTSLNGEVDAFVFRLDGAGANLLYSTFLGGSFPAAQYEEDVAGKVVAGTADVVYVSGSATTYDFPITAGAFDTTFGGDYEGFVAKLTTADNSPVTPTATATDTATPTETPTLGPTATPSATAGTPEVTATATEAAGTVTPTPTFTPIPSASATPTATATVPAVVVYDLYLPAIVTNP